MAQKVWVKIGDVITTLEQTTYFQLEVGGEIIFTNSQVWNELDYKYSEFSFLARQFETYATRFTTLYAQYCTNMGEQYARMLDAITRKYNPINNYEMIESGADGRKQSKKTDAENLNSVSATKNAGYSSKRNGTQDITKSGTETHDISYDEDQETNRYENAFDSGISAEGTHVSKDVTSIPGYTDETSFTGRTDSTTFTDFGDEYTYENNESQSITVGEKEISGTGNIATAGQAINERTEEYKNDVSVSAKKQNADGTESTLELGSNFTDGSMHVFTRSGNIGVTTSMQMVSGEMEREKLNLLKMWVHGFIYEYCTYIHGSDD